MGIGYPKEIRTKIIGYNAITAPCVMMISITLGHLSQRNSALIAAQEWIEVIGMAEWRVYDYDTPQCTHCGMWMPFARYRRGQSTDARSITDFCPSCGAKMTAMPMCETCKYGNGEWKDDGICFACREQVWIPGKPHRQVGNEA